MRKSTTAKLALFFSGLFAGGVLDHGLLALQGSDITSYGIHVGVIGNWGFVLMDGTIATLLFLLHRRFETGAHGAS
ncbi:MAG TPA: hypothetical protein VF605_19460 [Allosphingosinicella sp.]|jgi:hypothetical protein